MTATVDTEMLQSLGLMHKASPQSKTAKDMGQDDFLTLMLTQLQNQDPFKPMESGEFLSQIAQFGTVTGIKDLKTSFAQLATAMQSNQALQASSLVGRSVLVPSETGYLTQGGALKGEVELTSSAAELAVGIYDRAGQLVHQLNLGPHSAGRVQFTWDGQAAGGQALAPGKYAVRAAARIGNETVGLETLLEQTVESVSLAGGQGLTLNVTGAEKIDLANVKEIK